MSTSASIIIAEERRHPIVLYKLSDGGIAEYSPRYDRLAGAGLDLYEMVMRNEKARVCPGAETAANEFMVLNHGDCRIADSIHEDVEFIYTLQFKTASSGLKMCAFKAYAVNLWSFAADRASPVWKVATWLAEQVPSDYFERRYLIREVGTLIKKQRAALTAQTTDPA